MKPAGVGCDVGAPVAKPCEHDGIPTLKVHDPSEINPYVHRHTLSCPWGAHQQDAGPLILILTMIAVPGFANISVDNVVNVDYWI